jgi:hypothetical protein
MTCRGLVSRPRMYVHPASHLVWSHGLTAERRWRPAGQPDRNLQGSLRGLDIVATVQPTLHGCAKAWWVPAGPARPGPGGRITLVTDVCQLWLQGCDCQCGRLAGPGLAPVAHRPGTRRRLGRSSWSGAGGGTDGRGRRRRLRRRPVATSSSWLVDIPLPGGSRSSLTRMATCRNGPNRAHYNIRSYHMYIYIAN